MNIFEIEIGALLIWVCIFGNSVAGEGLTPAQEKQAYFSAQMQKNQEFARMDEYARVALALRTNAPYSDRLNAIWSLADNPTAHVDALESLMADPNRDLRIAAIEVIDPVQPGLAWKEAKSLLREAVAQSTNSVASIDNYIFKTIEFLARTGDGSGFPLLSRLLLQSPLYTDRYIAMISLRGFFYLQELKPYTLLVDFIDQNLCELNSADMQTRQEAYRLLAYAAAQLSGLHAVETIPDFKRWLNDPRAQTLHSKFESNLHELEAIQARLDAGEPDERDAIKQIPGVTPAWKFPTAVRD